MDIAKGQEKQDYFNSLTSIAKLAIGQTENLKAIIIQLDSISDKIERSQKLTAKAAMLYKQIMRNLHKAFITPIEREDIATAANQLLNILESVEEIANCFYILNIKSLNVHCVKLGDLVCDLVANVYLITLNLKQFKKLKKLFHLIDTGISLKGQIDKIYIQAVSELFGGRLPGSQLLIWKDVYDSFKAASKLCCSYQVLIEKIVLTNT